MGRTDHIMIIVGILVGVGLLLAFITLIDTSINDNLGSKEAGNQTFFKPDSPWNFFISKLTFYSDQVKDIDGKTWDDLCENMTEDSIFIDIAVNIKDAPNECQFFLDNKFSRKITDLTPPCYPNCPTKEMIHTLELGTASIHKKHIIRICCDDLCTEKLLRSPC